jgi:hypothetical protein
MEEHPTSHVRDLFVSVIGVEDIPLQVITTGLFDSAIRAITAGQNVASSSKSISTSSSNMRD